MSDKIISFDKLNARRDHNKMLIDRIQGVAAHPSTGSHVSPDDPNIRSCVELGCGHKATRFINLSNGDTGEPAGQKFWCDEHWPKHFDETD